MNQSEFWGTILILVESALEEFVVSEDDISLFLTNGAPLLGWKLGLWVKIQTLNLVLFIVATLMIDDILKESRDDLLPCPKRSRLNNCRRHCNDLVQLSVLKELSQAHIHKLLILVLSQESVLRGHEHTWNYRVLNKASDRLSTCWHNILSVSCHKFVGFRTGQVTLAQVQVHFISIEISIIGIAVSIVHSNSLFFGQNTSNVSHNWGFMKSRLTVDQKDISRVHMSIDYFPTHWELISKTSSLI